MMEVINMSKFKKLIILMSIFLFVFAYNICYAVDLNLVDNTDTSSDLTADNSVADDTNTCLLYTSRCV